MAKIHFKGVPCGTKPFGSEPNTQFWVTVESSAKEIVMRPFAANEIGFEPKPLEETDDIKKVTCKSCRRIASD